MINKYIAAVNRADHDRLAHAPDAPPPAETTAGNEDWRHGTREAEITNVEFLDGQGRPTELAYTKQPLTIRIHYHAKKMIPLPMFGLAIYHATGFHINGPNNVFGQYPIPHITGTGYVDYTMPSLPLLGGQYLVTVALLDTSGSHFYDSHTQHWSFHVASDNIEERYGSMYIPSTWHWSGNQGVNGIARAETAPRATPAQPAAPRQRTAKRR